MQELRRKLLENQQGLANRPLLQEVVFRLGVANLKFGETRNCCLRNTPESCILPIRGGGIHHEQQGSRNAIALFEEILTDSRPNSVPFLRAQWLLNIAYMTPGEYPDKVPSDYRISPELFASEGDCLPFGNVAGDLNLNTFDLCGGVVIDDFDQDDFLDIIVSSFAPDGPLRYFRNMGNGRFSERTEQAGLTDIHGGLNLVQADYDNDGDNELLVLRVAWLAPQFSSSE